MHEIDQTTEQMVRSVLAYAENRLRMHPVPLDIGTLPAGELNARLAGLIRDSGRHPDEVLGVYSSVIAPSIISTDSPRFLSFIPAAPTKASLLFDAVVSASSLNGTSWLEASGAVHAENQGPLALPDARGRACPPAPAGASSRAGRRRTSRRSPWPGRHHAAGGPSPRSSTPPARLRRGPLVDRQHARILDVDVVAVPTRRRSVDGLGVLVRSRPTPTPSRWSWWRDGRHHQRRDRRRPARGGRRGHGARRLVPRRRCLRRRRDLRAFGRVRASSASSWPTRWSSIRTSGCSRRSTARRCCTANLTWRAGSTPRTSSYLDAIHETPDEWNPSDYAYHLTRRARGLPLWFALACTASTPTGRRSRWRSGWRGTRLT